MDFKGAVGAVGVALAGGLDHALGHIQPDHRVETGAEGCCHPAYAAAKVECPLAALGQAQPVALRQQEANELLPGPEERVSITPIPELGIGQNGVQGIDRAPVLPCLAMHLGRHRLHHNRAAHSSLSQVTGDAARREAARSLLRPLGSLPTPLFGQHPLKRVPILDRTFAMDLVSLMQAAHVTPVTR